MQAVHDAYSRRRLSGRFKNSGQNIELDTLLHQEAKGLGDDDAVAQRTEQRKVTNEGPGPPCYSYQNGRCTFYKCKYRHVCIFCQSKNHGAINCNKKGHKDVPKSVTPKKSRPPQAKGSPGQIRDSGETEPKKSE